jgi:26S proteasome regulatory subunit N2
LYLLEYKKFTNWLKFFTGFSFSVINQSNLKFYQSFLNLVEKNWLSEYLKGGILIGMGINLRNSFEYIEFFVEKYFTILKNSSRLEENKYHIVKSGIYMGISLFSKMAMKDNWKQNFIQILISNITMGLRNTEISALSLGLYLQNGQSKYVLKNLMKLTNVITDEKTIKFLFFSLTLIFIENKEITEQLFIKLVTSENPSIRSSVVSLYSIAFAGLATQKIVNKVLKVISNDLDDNVKKDSVINLGFLFLSKFFLFENIINQFIDHFNPFIRCGACFAIGVSSFDNNSYRASELLQKLSNDKVDFVRQSSFIALGLTTLRDHNLIRKKRIQIFLEKKLLDKDHTELSRFGILIGYSLTEIGIKTNIKFVKNLDLTFLFIFIQYWHWLPCILFVFCLKNNV